MWIVITGAPSSGKTTLVTALEQRGYSVVGESAREVLGTTRNLDESAADVQRLIEERQKAKERALPTDQRIILDRALPDSLVYRTLVGMDLDELRPFISPQRYAVVFLCGFGEFFADGIRKDDRERSHRIEHLLREVYTNLGCKIIELPWQTESTKEDAITNRLHTIEDWLSQNQGGGIGNPAQSNV